MKKPAKFGLIISLLILLTSCSATKNIDNTGRDGSSFEKAIIVMNIDQEYEYLRKVCSDCQLLQQSLISNNKKFYDVIKLKKANGKEVSYYFDISKFYGKTSFSRF